MFSDLRDAYFDSSTLNNVAGNFNVYHGNKDTVLNILKNHVAAGALHNSGERFDSPKCHPGTRIAVLKKIGDWYRNKEASTPHVMWLYGAAGAGKSSIAQSMAEECHKLHTLAASFFFSRTAPGRNNSNRLMATIAYQVAQEISDTQPHIQQAIEKDPMIFSKSMETQLHHLVVEPLLHLVNSNSSIDESWPKLFIIDGLDECNGRETQQAIIHCFASALTQQTLPLYVLISSRSEQPIREVFSQPDRHWEYTPLVLDHEYQPDEDIALFLKANFSKIRSTHALKGSLPETWPSDSDIEALVQKSSGQFIFASTVMRYIRSPRHQPIHRLETILGLRRCGGPTPFAELDALYMHILQATEEDQYDTIMRIFGLLVCKGSGFLTYRMDKQSEIEGFLNLEFGHIYLALADCYSIVHLPPPEAGKSQVIRFLHASMSDFLLDPDRSHRFYLDQGKVHADLVRACIRGVGSLNETVQLCSSHALTRHCKLAHIDQVLLDDLLRFNLSNLFQIDTGHIEMFGLDWDRIHKPCLGQILWIREQVQKEGFDVPKEQLDHHFETLDQHIKEHLSRTRWLDHVPELYALALEIRTQFNLRTDNVSGRLHRSNIWKYAILLFHADPQKIQTRPEKSRSTDSGVFNWERWDTFSEFPKMPDAWVDGPLMDFLHNQKRAGPYYISQEVYARVALRCIEFIYEPYKHVNHAYYPDTLEPNARPTVHECDTACSLGLRILSFILSKAGLLKDLVEGLKLGESAHWSEIRDARVAYLEKYDNWKNNKPSDQTEVNPRTVKRPRELVDFPKDDGSTEAQEGERGRRRKKTTKETSLARTQRSLTVPTGSPVSRGSPRRSMRLVRKS